MRSDRYQRERRNKMSTEEPSADLAKQIDQALQIMANRARRSANGPLGVAMTSRAFAIDDVRRVSGTNKQRTEGPVGDLRPRLVDFGCKAGGCTRGYQLAGFHVTGVDVEPQPNYIGDEFHIGDMLTWPLDGYDAIHSSPPCPRYANVTKWRGNPNDHPDLLPPMLERLRGQSIPWVIENVPEALPTWDVVLCGSQFGLNVKRHRGFLAPGIDFPMLPPCQHHRGLLPFMHKGERAYADALGCHWMTSIEARQAIPPAMTEWIGVALLSSVLSLPGVQ